MNDSIISKLVKNRLGDYKQQINSVDNSPPYHLSNPKKVGIIGAGLAGISAAIYLSERNFNVTVFERDSFLGGKVGSWSVKFEDGYRTNVEHGFHAFFRQIPRSPIEQPGSELHLQPVGVAGCRAVAGVWTQAVGFPG